LKFALQKGNHDSIGEFDLIVLQRLGDLNAKPQ